MTIELYAGLSGRLLASVPTECIRDCSASGPVDAACAYWARHPSVTFGAADDIRADLRECGAWTDEQLADDDENRERVLWTACSSFAEDQHSLIREHTLGGPGLDGYAYCADTYCVVCGERIIRDLADKYKLPRVEDATTDDCPVPIFFGEHPDRSVNCATCGEYMYGEEPEANESEEA